MNTGERIQRAKDLLQSLEKRSTCVERTEIDKFEWETLSQNSGALKKLFNKYKNDYENIDAVYEDVFYTFYKSKPLLKETFGSVDESVLINRPVIEELMGLSHYEEMRIYTARDSMSAGIAVLRISEEIHDSVMEQLENLEAVKNQIKEAIEELENRPEDDEDGEDADQALSNLEGLTGNLPKVDVAGINFDDAVGDIISDLSNIMNMLNTWGINKSDAFIHMPFDEKIALVEKLKNNEALQKITDMLGKMQIAISAKKSKTLNKELASPQKLSLSGDLSKAIPLELMKFMDDGYDLLIFNKMLNHSLDSFECEDGYDLIKGPIVICIDESGSMRGLRDVWAKGTALTVLHQAQVENRSVYVIHFANCSSAEKLHVNEFKPSKPLELQDLIDVASHFYDGGTDYEQPLTRAMRCIDTEEDYDKADILFITDDQCGVNDEFLKNFASWKKEKGVHVTGVGVGPHANTSMRLVMSEFSDKVYLIKNPDEGSFVEVTEQILD